MGWILLFGAIVTEVFGTTFMKLSNGLSKLFPSAMMGVFYVISLILLAFSLKKIDIGVAYAIWSGLGIALITIIGALLFKEQINVAKVLSISLIIIGIITLNLFGGHK